MSRASVRAGRRLAVEARTVRLIWERSKPARVYGHKGYRIERSGLRATPWVILRKDGTAAALAKSLYASRLTIEWLYKTAP